MREKVIEGDSVDDVMKTLCKHSRKKTSSFLQTCPKLLCESNRLGLELETEFSRGLYDRDVRLRCKAWKYTIGESLTVVTFNGPVEMKDFTYVHDVIGNRFFNHHNLFISFIAESEDESATFYAYAGHHGSTFSKTATTSELISLASHTAIGKLFEASSNWSLAIPEMTLQRRSKFAMKSYK